MAVVWDQNEVDRVVDVYFSMLELELAGCAYSKSEFREQIMSEVDRSKGAVEYKLQNVSAVLAEIGAVFIDGYKPASNYQLLLRSRVVERFGDAASLRRTMLRAVEAPVAQTTSELEEASAVPDVPPRVAGVAGARPGVRGIDYQAIEAQNRALGLAGEEAVVRREIRFLRLAQRDDLAHRVRHASVEDGDGLGYDVRSFRPDGTERLLEVKTTRYSPQQPFLVTRNEVDLSVEQPDRFTLVRVSRFEAARTGSTSCLVPCGHRPTSRPCSSRVHPVLQGLGPRGFEPWLASWP